MEQPSSTTNTSDAETVTFSDSDSNNSVIDDFEFEYRCNICNHFNPNAYELAEAAIGDEHADSVIIVKNILWLRCYLCLKFFHLTCVPQQFTVSDLIDCIEQHYFCPDCPSV